MMDLIYYRDPELNFGDDLNELIWKNVLPEHVLQADHLSLVGIGSILNEERLGHLSGGDRLVAVLGSGTSYASPPAIDRNWIVAAVRGGFTAAVIGMPEAAVTDGAILLADVPGIRIGGSPDGDVVFMPHHRTLGLAPWERIAERAGMHYVTPQRPVDEILRAFANARLIVTEAMHGAIVADTLRIPWIPLVISPEVDEFKWRDWAGSMRLPFDPISIPAGSSSAHFRYKAMKQVLKLNGVDGHENLLGNQAPAMLHTFLARRFAAQVTDRIIAARIGSLPTRLRSRLMRPANDLFEAVAVRSLQRLVRDGTPFLSDNAVFSERLRQMREAIATVGIAVSRAAADLN